MLRAILLATVTAFLPPDGTTVVTPVVTSVVTVPDPAVRPVAPRTTVWQWPLTPAPAVAQPFHAPPTPWSAGHRGVDLAARPGQPVLSAGAGRITFAGPVAGRGVVVVTHPGGLRTSYEPVTSRALVGAAVAPGTLLGVVAATPGHCAPATCLHWGLRSGDTYLDPLTLLGTGPPVLKSLAGLSPP